MRRLALLLAFSAGALACCDLPTHADLPPRRPAANPPPPLTPELARRALLELMRRVPGKPFDAFQGDILERMAKIAIEKTADGKFRWTGACTLDPAAKTYALFIPRGDRLRDFIRPNYRGRYLHGRLYEGAFELRAGQRVGQWLATSPKYKGMLLD
jgi:hypothetical protein